MTGDIDVLCVITLLKSSLLQISSPHSDSFIRNLRFGSLRSNGKTCGAVLPHRGHCSRAGDGWRRRGIYFVDDDGFLWCGTTNLDGGRVLMDMHRAALLSSVVVVPRTCRQDLCVDQCPKYGLMEDKAVTYGTCTCSVRLVFALLDLHSFSIEWLDDASRSCWWGIGVSSSTRTR
jgi:hypothetical protein